MERSENQSESEIEEVEPFVPPESTEDRNSVMGTTEDRNSVMESTEIRSSVMNLSCGSGETFKRMIGNLFKNRENNRSKSESSEMAEMNPAEATGDRNCATDLLCGIGDAFQKILEVMNRSENPSESDIKEVVPFISPESTKDLNSVMESTEDRKSVMNLCCDIGENSKRMIGNLFKNRENNRSNSGTMEESKRIVLRDGTEWSAEVVLNGSLQIVVSWKNLQKGELLFLSKKATRKPHEARRGGIEINIFAVEPHGFARDKIWKLDTNEHDPSPLPPARNDESTVHLVLESTQEGQETCSHSVEFRLRISISEGTIILVPRVRNVDSDSFSFRLALCNYIFVADISDVRVEGLEALDYLDYLSNRKRCVELDAINFDEDKEVDRAYLSTPDQIAITDYKRQLTYILRKQGMPDIVVKKKAKSCPYLCNNEYKSLLCFDSAIIEKPRTLRRGEEWEGCQWLKVVPSGYYEGKIDRIDSSSN